MPGDQQQSLLLAASSSASLLIEHPALRGEQDPRRGRADPVFRRTRPRRTGSGTSSPSRARRRTACHRPTCARRSRNRGCWSDDTLTKSFLGRPLRDARAQDGANISGNSVRMSIRSGISRSHAAASANAHQAVGRGRSRCLSVQRCGAAGFALRGRGSLRLTGLGKPQAACVPARSSSAATRPSPTGPRRRPASACSDRAWRRTAWPGLSRRIVVSELFDHAAIAWLANRSRSGGNTPPLLRPIRFNRNLTDIPRSPTVQNDPNRQV